MCAIGRALMSRPKMILLDEPSMGLAPQLVEEIFEIVGDLNAKEGVSFLLAEQNTRMALKYARYGYVLENGRVVLDGEAKALLRERGRQGILSRHRRGPAQIVPRGQALSAAQALAGVAVVRCRELIGRRDCRPRLRGDDANKLIASRPTIRCHATRSLRQSRDPRSRRARARVFRPAARPHRACLERAGLGDAARRRRYPRR